MAVADAVNIPVYGQKIRITGEIVNTTTGVLIPTLTVLTANISLDGAAILSAVQGSPANGMTIVESPAASGLFYIDIDATRMTANTVKVYVTATNANAKPYVFPAMYPSVLTESAGHWQVQTIKRLEQSNVQMSAFMTNRHTVALALESVYARDDATLMFSSSISGIASASSTQTRNKLA